MIQFQKQDSCEDKISRSLSITVYHFEVISLLVVTLTVYMFKKAISDHQLMS